MKSWGNPAGGNKAECPPLLFGQDALPGDEELKEIVRRYSQDGYVLLYSTVLEDTIAFVKDADVTKRLPDGYIPYSRDELVELCRPEIAAISHRTLRLIHEAKKQGAIIKDRTERKHDR